MVVEILLSIIGIVVAIINKKKIYVFLALGIIFGSLYLNFRLWIYAGYIRRLSIIFYILFFMYLSKEEKR